jgi:cobalt-precorrin-5B (C1)-methyltransferase
MEKNLPSRGTRTGFTTGACSAAAAKAATRCLLLDISLEAIETTLPNRNQVTFVLKQCERIGPLQRCSIIKDAGDDPDATHGAEIVAEVVLRETPGIVLVGGKGVGMVTKPGLGLEVGKHAINPMPRKNITEMVQEELDRYARPEQGASVTISVPGGETMAKKTLNARLGILGGISILGTTGIVKPYSTSAWMASVIQAIDVAKARGIDELAFTTGGKSEQYAMAMYPSWPEEAFIQVGDFVGIAVRHAAKKEISHVKIVAMMGKLSKMANGKMMTHAAGSDVNMALLAEIAETLGATPELAKEIREATTARRVLELCKEANLLGIVDAVCRRAAEMCFEYAKGKQPLTTRMVDFDGTLLGEYVHPLQEEEPHG